MSFDENDIMKINYYANEVATEEEGRRRRGEFCLYGTQFPTVTRIFFAIERIAAMLDAIFLFWLFQISQIPIHKVVVIAGILVTFGRTSFWSKSIPFFYSALFAALGKYWPISTIECPTAMCNALTLCTRFHAILARVESLLFTVNIANVAF